jgi:hypothetical protein
VNVREGISKPAIVEVIKLCPKCFQQIGRGKRHPCKQNTPVGTRCPKILEEMINSKVPVESRERIATNITRSKVLSQVPNISKIIDLDIQLSNTGPN